MAPQPTAVFGDTFSTMSTLFAVFAVRTVQTLLHPLNVLSPDRIQPCRAENRHQMGMPRSLPFLPSLQASTDSIDIAFEEARPNP
jgi:hypothetical protein